MLVSWIQTQVFFNRYKLVFHKFVSPRKLTLSVLQACDITGGLYLKIPQKAALLQYLLVKSFRTQFYSSLPSPILKLIVFFLNSGCSCPTPSSALSCCCHHVPTWTTELRVSATETSLRLATCAQFVYQVSFNPSLNKEM